ncbi:hypothetical protein DITRI_Ditri13aG0040600 [Diplodiscus trichospermus]
MGLCVASPGRGSFWTDSSQRNSSEVTTFLRSLVNGIASADAQGTFVSNYKISKKSAIAQLEFCVPIRLLLVLYSDGLLVSCSVSKKGLKPVESIKAEKSLGSGDAVCTSIAGDQQILAVGTRRGVVELYDLAESGYSMDDTGSVSCIAWTPDNSAFAVGWKLRGLTVWSVSGCHLMSTIRQIGLSSVSSPVVKRNQDCKYEPLMGGTSLMQWDEYGRGVSGITYIRQVIYGEDRLLVVQSEDTDELKMLHLNLPVSYISQNWPVQHVAASKDGMYLVVAGLHGLILYDIMLKKCRVFGDISQEQKIQCKGLLWMGKIVVLCNYIDSSNM